LDDQPGAGGRSWRWTASPGSRRPPPKPSKTWSARWARSTSSPSPATSSTGPAGRVQRELIGERGRGDDPLYKARRLLCTGRSLLNDTQQARLDTLWTDDDLAAVGVTEVAYQDHRRRLPGARSRRREKLLTTLIDTIKAAVKHGFDELARLGRTLPRRHPHLVRPPGSSNGRRRRSTAPRQLRGIAISFHNLTNARIRSLLDGGGFRRLTDSLSFVKSGKPSTIDGASYWTLSHTRRRQMPTFSSGRNSDEKILSDASRNPD
jgi:hypothetical protein